ncbi:MAG: hypothetical protein ACKVPY_11955 [Paracoccaceae bacterium]
MPDRTCVIGRAGAAAVSALFFAAIPALAADPLFKPPAGCTVYATAQHRSCQVSQHYRCTSDAPGDQWAIYGDGVGPHFASKIDAETRWVESISLETGETDRLGTDTDPASFSALIQSGRDDFDFTTLNSAGVEMRYKGYDQLTGEKVTIDGVVLERTRFELSAYEADGGWAWTRKGAQFIHRDWRIFFSDREEFSNAAGDTVNTLDTPVSFAFPGDAGFLSMKPDYDCDVVTASLGAVP